ncbi:hypothetical protein [Thalassotalea sp. SU-HH00458]|uniref:hypothetical protein n=1 Tax=Thalassotalea sp. SU-HH00458 TaxID=3127657 RepID=UPI0031099E42
MWKLLPFSTPIINILEGMVDSCRDPVIPIVGSIVYCDIAFGYAEHSGVYIGNNQIIHLNGKGDIEAVSPQGFMSNTTALNIYVSCNGLYPVGGEFVAVMAQSKLYESIRYNVLLENCHIFTSGCLGGDFSNAHSFMWMLKDEAKKCIQATTWRQWDSNHY